jgi:GNAT superfamily N-acetyltransferase
MVRWATASDAAGIAAAHVQTWRSAYAGILPPAVLESLSIAGRAKYWGDLLADATRPSIVLVAELENAVAGFVCAGPERAGDAEYKAGIYALYVLPQHQSRGLGRCLLLAAVDGLLSSGFGSLLVWVLADNPYRRFYDGLGGEVIRARSVEIGGVELAEVAHGWRSMTGLAQSQSSGKPAA